MVMVMILINKTLNYGFIVIETDVDLMIVMTDHRSCYERILCPSHNALLPMGVFVQVVMWPSDQDG